MPQRLQDRINLLNRIAADAFRDAVEIMELIAMLEAGNKKTLMRKLRGKGAGRAGLLVRNALFTRLHLYTARAYTTPTRKDDLHLRRGFELAEESDVRNYLKGRRSLPALVRAEKAWRACNANSKLRSFMHFRHKLLAHWSDPGKDISLPTYGIVFEIARDTAKAMEKFANATGVVSLSLKSQMVVPKRGIAAFWKPWKTGVKS